MSLAPKPSLLAMRITRQVLATLAALWLLPADARAQQPQTPAKAEIELTDEQLELNNKAVEALNSGRPEVAIDYMRAAIRERDAQGTRGDILFLTLGRAYQLRDDCDRAREHFATVELEPHVRGVPRDFVPKKLAQYRADFERLCSAQLSVSCEDANAEISINEDALGRVCGTTIKLKPGPYTLRATVTSGEPSLEEHAVTLRGDERRVVAISLRQTETIIKTEIRTERPVPVWAITTGATTLALSGGLWGYGAWARSRGESAYVDYKNSTTPAQAQAREQIVRDWEQRARRANRAGLGVAALGVGVTAALLLWPTSSSEGDPSAAWVPALQLEPGRAWGISLGRAW